MFIALVMAAFLGMGASGCDEESSIEKQARSATKARASNFDRAQKLYPAPKNTNFPLRRDLRKMTERQDLVNHPWYVYLLGMNGNAVGYYVAKTVPINACNFLSSTEAITEHEDAPIVLTAPSLDGIFYGGGGTSAGCDAWFFFDQATDALIQIRGVNWFSSDKPLRVDAEAIKVAQ